MPITYTRFTLTGSQKRVDLVMPATTPIAKMVPDLCALLEEPATLTPQSVSITTDTGATLDPDATLAECAIADGSVLHMVMTSTVPPPPSVHDVTDEAALDLEQRSTRWSQRAQQVTATSVLGLACLVIGTLVVLSGERSSSGTLAILIICAVSSWLLALGLLAGRRVWPGTALAAGALGFAAPTAVELLLDHGWTRTDSVASIGCAAAISLGLVGGVGYRHRGAVLGALLGVLLSGGWIALSHTHLRAVEVPAIVAFTATALLGLIPLWALNLSGLAGLDDRRVTGHGVPRDTVDRSLTAAHEGLTWMTVVLAGLIAISGAELGLSHDGLAIGLGGTCAAVTLLRSRTFPLTGQVVALVAAASVIGTATLIGWVARDDLHPYGAIAVAAGVALLCFGWLVIAPNAQVRARLRRTGDRLELVAVLALVPLFVGAFGVYDRLLHTF